MQQEAVPDVAKLIVADTRDTSALDRIFQEYRIDAVMHFGPSIEARRIHAGSRKYFATNGHTLPVEAMLGAPKWLAGVSLQRRALWSPTAPPLKRLTRSIHECLRRSKLLVEQISYFMDCGIPVFANFNAGSAAILARIMPASHLIPLNLAVALRKTRIHLDFRTDYRRQMALCPRLCSRSDLARPLLVLDALRQTRQAIYNLVRTRF